MSPKSAVRTIFSFGAGNPSLALTSNTNAAVCEKENIVGGNGFRIRFDTCIRNFSRDADEQR